MESIGMAGCELGVEGAKAMAELVSVTGSLTSLDIGSNNLTNYGYDMTGITAIAEALKVNGSLTSLYLAGNGIGPNGAVAIGEALKVNSSLTKLDVRYNSRMGECEEGNAALQKAVEGRFGFELML